MATGENSGAWGTITNNNLSAIEEAIARTTDVTFADDAPTASVTLTDSNALQAGRNYRLNLIGTGTAGHVLLLPTVEKSYLINNTLSVDVSVRNGTAAGTNLFNTQTVPAGGAAIVYTDGSAVTSAVSSASAMEVSNVLSVGGAASVGGTLGIKGNVSSEGTLSVIGAVSVGGTLGVTSNVSVTGTLAIEDEFTFATANSTGNLGVVGNASVGGTFHIQGNASAQGTLNVKGAVSVSSTLGVEGDIDNESGNLTINPATQIVEVKGDGSSVEGQIQLNCHDNSHGQRLRAQPHSEGVTNTMLLPQGASSTLVSQVGTATLTNKTYLDVDGNLRAVPVSRELATQLGTAAATDTGNFILMKGTASSTQTLVLAADTFSAGDIFTVVNSPFGGKTAAAVTTFSAAQMNSCFVAGAETSTALVTLAYNGVASVLFASANGCIITGNVS